MRREAAELAADKRLKTDIGRLKGQKERLASWSDRAESGKIGTHSADRGYIGHKAAKVMARSKNAEKRMDRAIAEKKELLKDVEESEALRILPLAYKKSRIAELKNVSLRYGEALIFEGLNLTLNAGEITALCGANGGGKSSVLRFLAGEAVPLCGGIEFGADVTVSYLPQGDGDIAEYAARKITEYAALCGDKTLFLTLLAKLNFERSAFDTPIGRLSEGEKRKLLLAKSLASRAHLYIWDEPLNYVDILSRVQIEKLLLAQKPAMLLVEHDRAFTDAVGDREGEI
jgi:lincosamide and streptogramin A transport system ATP-binding/permease protein